ncbi:hypothetical protein [Halorubrum vacuolatum]|nr:hypothetical protein [Halorubrum vacuolatum]
MDVTEMDDENGIEATSETPKPVYSASTRLSRRRLTALAIPIALAGCFEEPEPAPGEPDDPSDDTGGNGDDDDGTDANGADDDDGDDGDDDDDGDDGDDDGDDGDDDDGEPTPDRVDPEDAGVTVTEATVTDVTECNTRTIITAELEVENTGRFEYGILEFRVDAYKTRPNDPSREPVGFEYRRARFGPGDRFSDGDETVSVEVDIRSRDGAMRADPNWYDVDAAVRHAEPSDG